MGSSSRVLDSYFTEAGFMDVDQYNGDMPQLDLPGGDDFYDITNIVGEAAQEMEHGSLLMMDGFELQQAMNAFEIGEPRLDTGVINASNIKPPFNALEPLLPSEVCWIMDRSFAYEMLWHAGNCLPHSVLTIQYVHHLGDMDHDFSQLQSTRVSSDPSRPIELVTVVLRAFMSGLLKCCDFAWRKLNEGAIREIEDWQPDKCDVSFLEGMPPAYIFSKLEEAILWVAVTPKIPQEWKEPIRVRLLLRNIFLQLLGLDVYKDRDELQFLIRSARQYLDIICRQPSPEPLPGSAALLAFDPYLPRLLTCSVPLRILDVPPIEEVWQTLARFLDDWSEIGYLSTTHKICTWERAGTLKSYLPVPSMPYLRSTAQVTFYDGFLVLHKFTPSWVVERFFFETMGIRYHILSQGIRDHWKGSDAPPFAEMERQFIKLIIPYLQSHWQNPPRRRRFLTKSLLAWHKLYDLLTEMVGSIDTNNEQIGPVLRQLPNAVLSCRFNVIREVLFSGFQLDLYTSEERAYAYLYAAKLIESHLSHLEQLNSVVPEGSTAKSEIAFYLQSLTAIQLICVALFSVVIRLTLFNPQRLELNFIRRYKWAFRPEYDSIATPVVASPEFDYFMLACREILEDQEFSPSGNITLARAILLRVTQDHSLADYWNLEQLKFVQSMIDICNSLEGLPSSSTEIKTFDAGLLLWDPTRHPWFPVLSVEGAEQRRKRITKPNFV